MRLNRDLCIAQGHSVCCEFQASHMFESTSQQRLQTLKTQDVMQTLNTQDS